MFKKKRSLKQRQQIGDTNSLSNLACNICAKITKDYLTLHKNLSSGGNQIHKVPVHLTCLLTDQGKEFIMLQIGLNNMPDDLDLESRANYMQIIGKRVTKEIYGNASGQ